MRLKTFGPVPGQELAYAGDQVVRGEVDEHVGEIGAGLDAIELCGLDDRGEDGPVLATTAKPSSLQR